MSGWYCAACGARADAAGACPHDHQPLARVDGLLGAVAGNFTLVELVGRGGMGEVLRGINPMLGATVAVKVLHATAQTRDATRFLTEARAVNRIAHDGVVKIVDGGYLDTGRPYLVMELLDGASLEQARAARSLPVAEAVQVIDDVLDIVGAAHAAGIVHRDLKPANVLLARRGRTMVLDFGVAKLLDGTSSITRTGAMVGTPGYMAPEQIHAGPVDARTDLYAVGVMLFELLAGRPPFEGANRFEIMRAHVSAPVPRLPPALAAFQPVIDKALAKELAERFPSAEAMRSALAACARAPAPAARSSTRRWLLGGGALVVLGLAIGVVVGMQRRAPPALVAYDVVGGVISIHRGDQATISPTVAADMFDASRRLLHELNAPSAGVAATALVRTFTATGYEVNGPHSLASVEIEVSPPDGAPFAATVVGVFTAAGRDAYAPGKPIAVRFDPADHTRVTLDRSRTRIQTKRGD